MSSDDDCYANGRSKTLQAEADKRYRTRQAAQRDWVRDVASYLGVEPHELLKTSAATVADLIRVAHQGD